MHSPLSLEPVNEKVDGSSRKRIAAHEQRLKREYTSESIVPDVSRHQSIYGAIALEAHHRRQNTQHVRRAVKRPVRQLCIADIEDALCMCSEPAVAIHVPRADRGDLLEQAVFVAGVVEAASIGEQDSVKRVDRY